MFFEIVVKSLIRITVNRYHLLALNKPKYIVRCMYSSGLEDPDNENYLLYFNRTLVRLSNTVSNTLYNPDKPDSNHARLTALG